MIRILATGKIKEREIATLIEEYQKRIERFQNIEIVEIKDEKVTSDIEKIKEIEGERILRQIKDNDFTIVCDETGKGMNSKEFSYAIKNNEQKNIVFIIGGANGLSENVKKRAHLLLSFSKMTFPHQLFRLFLIEQIYRAITIQKGIDYHK